MYLYGRLAIEGPCDDYVRGRFAAPPDVPRESIRAAVFRLRSSSSNGDCRRRQRCPRKKSSQTAPDPADWGRKSTAQKASFKAPSCASEFDTYL